VKDADKFKAFLYQFDGATHFEHTDSEGVTRHGWYNDTEYGDQPHMYNDDDDLVYVMDGVAEHLVEGEVLVYMEAGHEKARYVTGWAEAIDHTGEVVCVSIDDIYVAAQAQFSDKYAELKPHTEGETI